MVPRVAEVVDVDESSDEQGLLDPDDTSSTQHTIQHKRNYHDQEPVCSHATLLTLLVLLSSVFVTSLFGMYFGLVPCPSSLSPSPRASAARTPSIGLFTASSLASGAALASTHGKSASCPSSPVVPAAGGASSPVAAQPQAAQPQAAPAAGSTTTLTFPFTNYPTLADQAFMTMGYATGQSINDLYPFIASYRETGCMFCRLILFISPNPSDELRAMLRRLRVEVYYHTPQLIENIHRSYPQLFDKNYDPLALKDCRESPAQYRWLVFEHLVRALQGDFSGNQPFTQETINEAIKEAYQDLTGYPGTHYAPAQIPIPTLPIHTYLFCDVRDSIFQSNFFHNLHALYPESLAAGGGLYAFEEMDLIRNQALNADWQRCVGSYDETKDRQVICAGSIAVTANHALPWFSVMNKEMIAKCRCTDQGHHTRISYLKLYPSVTVCSWKKGPIGTVGTMKSAERNMYGDLINQEQHPYAMLHQYDRMEMYTRHQKQRYELFDAGQRREKDRW